jgi:hypothetical protein
MPETQAPANVYDFVGTEQTNYETTGVQVAENYEWKMRDHIQTAVLYKMSQYAGHVKAADEPFKNIILPLLRLQYRSEGFDVKDIELYVEEEKNYFKSFLIKKKHDRWAREVGLDTFIDKTVEAYVDFGGALVKDIGDLPPEVVPWQRIAFCDQTDIMSGPICEKHFYSPDQLKDMEKQGWGNPKAGATTTIDEVIALSKNAKKDKTQDNKTPSKYIEVYELHGVFPVAWLEDEDYELEDGQDYETTYVRQLHIITFYKDEKGDKKGLCLFKKKETKLPYKLVLRDEVYGRALGLGGVEELVEPQVWTNYDEIRKKQMLDAASKVIHQTTDAGMTTRNKLNDLENNEVLILEDGKTITQINTTPINIALFEKATEEWDQHAQRLAAGTDAMLGENPSAGTPFKLQDLIVQQGQGIHDYRRGKLATFFDEIYRNWIVPRLARELAQGDEFLSELDLDELQSIAEQVATNYTNRAVLEHILQGGSINPEEVDAYAQMILQDFLKGGNKRFVEILKDELKDAPISVKTNIAGKQKNLSSVTDKLVNVFRQIVAAPQVLTYPPMAKLFNQIIEASGLDPIDFSGFTVEQQEQPQPTKTAQPVADAAPITINA